MIRLAFLSIFYWLAVCFYINYSEEDHHSYGEHFSAPNIVNQKKESVSLEEILMNEYVIIDYWFSSCKPCVRQMQMFPNYLEENPNFTIISIANDFDYNWEASILPNNLFGTHENWKHYRVDLEYNRSPQTFLNDNKINIFPTYFLLGDEGEILRKSDSIKEIFQRKESKVPDTIWNMKNFLFKPLQQLVTICFSIILGLLTLFVYRMLFKAVKIVT